jgi:hypothetical protein
MATLSAPSSSARRLGVFLRVEGVLDRVVECIRMVSTQLGRDLPRTDCGAMARCVA